MKATLLAISFACAALLTACGGSVPANGTCTVSADCGTSQTCNNGVCILGSGGGSGGGSASSCNFNSDCPSGDICTSGVCERGSAGGGSGGGSAGGGSAGGSAGGSGGGSAGGSAGGSGGGSAGGSAGGSGGGSAGGSAGGSGGGSAGGSAGGSGGSGGGSAGGSAGGSGGGSAGGSAGGSGGGSAGGSAGGSGGGSASCSAEADYGTPDVTNTEEASLETDPNSGIQYYDFEASVNDPSDTDLFDMQLVPGYGAFAAGSVTTGTFTISGDDADPTTCGLCLFIYPAFDSTATTGDVYFATSGTVTISQLTPDLAGTITNATFAHYTYDNSAQTITLSTDGCASAIDELDFDAPVSGGSGGTCAGGTDYGTVTTTNQGAINYGDGSYQYAAALDSNNDIAYFELYDQAGVFANGLTTGTYDLSQDAVEDYADCGACIFILVNPSATDTASLDPFTGDSDEVFMAVSGTLEIDTLSTRKFKGSLTNVSYVEVDIDPNTYDTTVGTDCASLDSLTINASISQERAANSKKLQAMLAKVRARHAHVRAATRKHGLLPPRQARFEKKPQQLLYTPDPQ